MQNNISKSQYISNSFLTNYPSVCLFISRANYQNYAQQTYSYEILTQTRLLSLFLPQTVSTPFFLLLFATKRWQFPLFASKSFKSGYLAGTRRNRGVKKRKVAVITFVEGVKSVEAALEGARAGRLAGYFCELPIVNRLFIANPLRYIERRRGRLIFTGKSPWRVISVTFPRHKGGETGVRDESQEEEGRVYKKREASSQVREMLLPRTITYPISNIIFLLAVKSNQRWRCPAKPPPLGSTNPDTISVFFLSRSTFFPDDQGIRQSASTRYR